MALAKYHQAISAKALCFLPNIPLAEANGNDFYTDIKIIQSNLSRFLVMGLDFKIKKPSEINPKAFKIISTSAHLKSAHQKINFPILTGT